MFAVIVLLGAAHMLRVNEHVRVDLFYGIATPRAPALDRPVGLGLFLLPSTLVIAGMSWPLARRVWRIGEVSSNAGGLLRWPVKLLLPFGFALLALQGVAELIAPRSRCSPARIPARRSTRGRCSEGHGSATPMAESMAPDMFAGLVVFLLIGFPVAFSLSALGLFFGILAIEAGLLRAGVPAACPARVRHHVERPAARDPVLHLHGHGARAQRARRGPARGHRPAVRRPARAGSPTR